MITITGHDPSEFIAAQRILRRPGVLPLTGALGQSGAGDFVKLMLMGTFLLAAGGAVGYAIGLREGVGMRRSRTGRRKR